MQRNNEHSKSVQVSGPGQRLQLLGLDASKPSKPFKPIKPIKPIQAILTWAPQNQRLLAPTLLLRVKLLDHGRPPSIPLDGAQHRTRTRACRLRASNPSSNELCPRSPHSKCQDAVGTNAPYPLAAAVLSVPAHTEPSSSFACRSVPLSGRRHSVLLRIVSTRGAELSNLQLSARRGDWDWGIDRKRLLKGKCMISQPSSAGVRSICAQAST